MRDLRENIMAILTKKICEYNMKSYEWVKRKKKTICVKKTLKETKKKETLRRKKSFLPQTRWYLMIDKKILKNNYVWENDDNWENLQLSEKNVVWVEIKGNSLKSCDVWLKVNLSLIKVK